MIDFPAPSIGLQVTQGRKTWQCTGIDGAGKGVWDLVSTPDAAADSATAARDAAVAAAATATTAVAPFGALLLGRTPTQQFGVYNPAITRGEVISAATSTHKYGHDVSIEWFVDRWICLWNANTSGIEAEAPQYILQSESFDFITWSAPVKAFNDSAYSTNPVPFPGNTTQWQPGMIVVGSELWAMWRQDGSSAATYFSKKTTPAGKWTHAALNVLPYVRGGITYVNAFVTGDLVQLPSGRVLAPVVMQSNTTVALPVGLTPNGFFERLKLAGVVYTDDGVNWQVGGMVTPRSAPWSPWEPFIAVQADGAVRLIVRSLDTTASSDQQALTTVSIDDGQSFMPLQPLRADTVSTRGTVINRTQTSAPPVMLLNDNRKEANVITLADRRNMAVWVGTGTNDFVPGIGISDDALDDGGAYYPSGRIRNGKLYVAYSTSRDSAGYATDIRTLVVDPAPSYSSLLPRTNASKYTSPKFDTAPYRCFRYWGAMRISTLPNQLVGTSGTAMSIALMGNFKGTQPALLDTRDGAGKGVLVKLSASRTLIVGVVNAAASNAYVEIDTGVAVQYEQPVYVGLSIDGIAGSVTAYAVTAGGIATQATVFFGFTIANMNTPAPAYFCGPRPGSSLANVRGLVHLEYIFDAVLTASQHRSIQQLRAATIGMTAWAGATAAPTGSIAEFDANNIHAGTNNATWLSGFTPTDVRYGYVEQATVESRAKLKITGSGSVGVPPPFTVTGQPVHYTFRYRASPARSADIVVATVGGSDKRMTVVLTPAGLLKARWLTPTTSSDLTMGTGVTDGVDYVVHVVVSRDRLTMIHEGFDPVTVRFRGRPLMFVGDGWPTSTAVVADYLLLDVASVAAKPATIAETEYEEDFLKDFTPAAAADFVRTITLPGDTQARWRQSGSGKLEWGTGAATPDVSIDRRNLAGINVLAPASTHSLGVNMTWNTGRFVMGASQVWQDSLGTRREKTTTPANETDGSVFSYRVHTNSATEIIRQVMLSTVSKYTQRGDGQMNWTLLSNTDVALQVGIAGEGNPRLEILGEGKINFGPGGAVTPPVSLVYRLIGATHSVGTTSAHCFSVGSGLWNAGHLIMGVDRYFYDATNGMTRVKRGTAPTAETDGNVIVERVSVPASATAPGKPGQIASDANFKYDCTAVDTWKRAAHATW